MDKNDSAMTAHIVSMISGTHRKRHVPLDNRSLEICLQMARDGKTSKEIARYSGQDIRSAQRIVKRALDIEEPNNIYDVKIERRGPKPLSDESLSQEIQSILEADNSLTIKGIYCFNYRNSSETTSRSIWQCAENRQNIINYEMDKKEAAEDARRKKLYKGNRLATYILQYGFRTTR